MASQFLVFPWQQAFLPALKDFIAHETGGDAGRALIIVPNQRPWRYLGDLYARDKMAGLLPRMLPFSQIATIWSAAASDSPYCQANPLDQIFLLAECVRELATGDATLSAKFATMTMARFLPWGRRLASLIEEIFSQGIEPKDITPPPDEVEPLAAALLSSLGRIAAAYRAKLDSARPRLVTPGLESLIASQHSANIPQYLLPRPERPVFIAGFASLNGAENKLFHSLWQAGARICLHGDPALAGAGELHDAARPQMQWIKEWKAGAKLANASLPSSSEYHFYAAYDNHSQLKKMAADLEDCDKNDPAASTAIVLPDPGLLMPVLHHLPGRDVNISMGYPLRRTQLGSLIDDIFQVQIRRAPDGRYYWRNLVRLFQQPCLDIIADPENRGVRLRPALRRMVHVIRNGTSRYVDLAELQETCGEHIEDSEKRLLALALKTLVSLLAPARTARELASALGRLCDFLIEYGGNGWKRFPLDTEALSRLQNHILPVLAKSMLKDEQFPMPVLYGLVATLIDQERIPFEADPLVGVQILGLLETRLLHFDQVFILNATDDVLPGHSSPDPLLPESLRPLAGLPDYKSRQGAVEYNLYRLLAGAKNVYFYWSEGVALSSLGAAKQYRSRYVEQLIWKEEQKRKKLLAPGDGLLVSAQAHARINRKLPRAITASQKLKTAMAGLLTGEMSATMLNEYLKCPASFVMRRLLKLASPSEVNEGDDPAAVGTCIHRTLADLLAPYKGQQTQLSDIEADDLQTAFARQLAEMEMADKLPVDSYIMLERAGQRRLYDYLQKNGQPTLIKALEIDVPVKVSLLGRDYNFKGKIDRIDERDGQEIILDYKTGKLHKPEDGLWEDQAFFDALRNYCAKYAEFDQQGDALLAQLAERLPDVQLPVYMLMQTQKSGRIPGNAAYVDLRDSGKEVALFPEMDDAGRKRALRNCESAVAFILRHMESRGEFMPGEAGCEYCEFAPVCQT